MIEQPFSTQSEQSSSAGILNTHDPLATFITENPHPPVPDSQAKENTAHEVPLSGLVPLLHALHSSISDILHRVDQITQYVQQSSNVLNNAQDMAAPRSVSAEIPTPRMSEPHAEPLSLERIVEGTFDGYSVNGFDGRQYTVPPNYASKSKLVEGDHMKLTISKEGTFMYKQIKAIERKRVLGVLEQEESTRDFYVRSDQSLWRVLTASITYYKGFPGDEVVVLVPRYTESTWAAVENIIKRV
jgi:hypothetical protein